MVNVGGTPVQHALVRAAPQAVAIGLAIKDVELIVEAEGIGPPGPPGPAVTVWEQPDAPLLSAGIRPGDFWVKKPPNNVVPQPLFFWTGTAWLPIYGETSTGGYYEHTQAVASARWSITHLLHYEPLVSIENTAGNDVRGSVTYVDPDHVTIDFSEPIAGVARLGSPSGGSPVIPAGGTYSVHGDLAAFIGTKQLYNDTGSTLSISKVRLAAGTPPMGRDLIVDVNKGGTTIFTTQANRPRLVAGQTTSVSNPPNVTAWNDGEYLTIDIDQAGLTQPGSDLTITVVCV